MTTSSGLGSRDDALARLADTRNEPLDVLVIGGGITGAGAALDAASRGLKVGLVERFDFAVGTSSKSSKLIHGGLRYLEQREFGLVREASMERQLLTRLAPHLVEPLQLVIPVSNRWKRAMFGVGLWTYDALASFKNIKVHRYLDIEETEALVPALPRGKLQGGFMFYDSKTDDVRLVMEVLIQARRHGATVVNYSRVVDLTGSSEICSVVVEDALLGETLDVRAKRVIVAAGVWSDQIESLAKNEKQTRLRPSKGIHLVFDRAKVPLAGAAAFIPDAERKRMLFVLPWLDSVLIGTTDTPYEGELDSPTVEAEDRRYCLEAINSAFELELDESDIAGAYAGLRPLVAGKAGATADLSRRHALYEIAPGVTGITGGKFTTYRRMAVDVVDRATADLGTVPKSRTRSIPLGSTNVATLRLAVERRARRLGMDDASISHLVRCYGDRSFAVLDLAAAEGLTTALCDGFAPIGAEVAYVIRHEMAARLSDVLGRRTRLALIDSAAGVGRTSHVAELMRQELNWSQDQAELERAAHMKDVERERGLVLHEPNLTPSPAGAG